MFVSLLYSFLIPIEQFETLTKFIIIYNNFFISSNSFDYDVLLWYMFFILVIFIYLRWNLVIYFYKNFFNKNNLVLKSYLLKFLFIISLCVCYFKIVYKIFIYSKFGIEVLLLICFILIIVFFIKKNILNLQSILQKSKYCGLLVGVLKTHTYKASQEPPVVFDLPRIYGDRGTLGLPIFSFDGERLMFNPIFTDPKVGTLIGGFLNLKFVIESPGLNLAWSRLENHVSRNVGRTFWYYPLIEVLQTFNVVHWADYPMHALFYIGSVIFIAKCFCTFDDPFSYTKIVSRKEWQKLWHYFEIDKKATWETLPCVRENPTFAEKIAKHLGTPLKIRDFDGSFFREVTPSGDWFSLHPQTGEHLCSLFPHQPYTPNPELFVLWDKLCPEMTIRIFMHTADKACLDLVAENMGVWYAPLPMPWF